jgi:transcription factor S
MLTCPEHKVLLKPVPGKGFACPKCGWMEKHAAGEIVVKGMDNERRIDKFSDLGIIEDPAKFEMQIWPIDDQVYCGKCNNRGAYYYLRQTRKADEPTTAFYRCTKCKNQWKRAR